MEDKSDLSQNSYSQSIYSFNFYISVIFLPFGIMLNFFSIFIFLRKKFKPNNNGYLNILFIISQLTGLAFGFVINSFLPSVGIDIYDYSNFSCRFLNYLRRIFLQFASWCQVLITLDLLLLIRLTNRYHFFKKKSNIFKAVALMISILGICNITNLFYSIEAINTYNNSSSTKRCTLSKNKTLAADIISILMRTLIPFFSLLFFNIVIIKSFLNQKKKLNLKNSQKRKFQLLINIILMNTVFFVIFIPLAILYLLKNIENLNPLILNVVNDKLKFVYEIFFSISCIYLNLSFFINFLFNKNFRNEIMKLINSNCRGNKIGVFKINSINSTKQIY